MGESLGLGKKSSGPETYTETWSWFRLPIPKPGFGRTLQGRPFPLPSQRNFPISLKPKVAIAEFFWKMQRKTWYSIFGVDAMPLSLKNLLLNHYHVIHNLPSV